jgi:hypothetical protein
MPRPATGSSPAATCGDPLGNEEEGRSQIVMTEGRDTVLVMLPGLLRIFVSSEDVVEFVPTTALTVDLAEQQGANTGTHCFVRGSGNCGNCANLPWTAPNA